MWWVLTKCLTSSTGITSLKLREIFSVLLGIVSGRNKMTRAIEIRVMAAAKNIGTE